MMTNLFHTNTSSQKTFKTSNDCFFMDVSMTELKDTINWSCLSCLSGLFKWVRKTYKIYIEMMEQA